MSPHSLHPTLTCHLISKLPRPSLRQDHVVLRSQYDGATESNQAATNSHMYATDGPSDDHRRGLPRGRSHHRTTRQEAERGESILVLSFAAVNEEFREEVMGFKFKQKKVKVVCNDIGAVLTSTRSTAGFRLFLELFVHTRKHQLGG